MTFFAIKSTMGLFLDQFKKVFDSNKKESKVIQIPSLSNEIITMVNGNIYQNFNSILCSSLCYCLSSLNMKNISMEGESQHTNNLQILQALARIKG